MFVVLPNQLYPPHLVLKHTARVAIVEHPAYFVHAHKAKVVLHRASMKAYQAELAAAGGVVTYYENYDEFRKAAAAIALIDIIMFDPIDKNIVKEFSGCTMLANPGFFIADPSAAPIDKKFTSFYIWFRRTYGIMVASAHSVHTGRRTAGAQQPTGGRWSFDSENRKPFPKNYVDPYMFAEADDASAQADAAAAIAYCESKYAKNYGLASLYLPHKRSDTVMYVHKFVTERLADFGRYEDAIKSDVNVGNHSCMSALLNIGLVSPQELCTKVVRAGAPIASTEAFVRQLAWREYVRCCYVQTNFATTHWAARDDRAMPAAWFTAPLATGIVPVDNASRRLFKYGYMHHIERLMVCGNFFLLCEFRVVDVYKWFMLFIDAYPWVMIPNIYGMSQDYHIMKRPYFSSSNYVLKMSDYPRGSWCAVWDDLYNSFVYKNRDVLAHVYATAAAAARAKRPPSVSDATVQFLRKYYMPPDIQWVGQHRLVDNVSYTSADAIDARVVNDIICGFVRRLRPVTVTPSGRLTGLNTVIACRILGVPIGLRTGDAAPTK